MEVGENTVVPAVIRSQLLEQDPDFAEEVLLFVDDLSEKIKSIQEWVQCQEWKQIQRTAHNLTSAETFGYPSFTEVMKKLDFSSAMQEVENVHNLVREATVIAEAIIADREYVSSLLNS